MKVWYCQYQLYNTFHFHNCFIRNILVSCRSLSCQALLVNLVIGHNDHSSSAEALKGTCLPFLGARVNIRLENWENCNIVIEPLPDMSYQRSTEILRCDVNFYLEATHHIKSLFIGKNLLCQWPGWKWIIIYFECLYRSSVFIIFSSFLLSMIPFPSQFPVQNVKAIPNHYWSLLC